METFKIWLNDNVNFINEKLEKCIESLNNTKPPSEILTLTEAMKNSLTNGGKRLRPLLCIASAEFIGASREEALPAALAIEMIHAYSLIHDDLPALDNDDLRRGKPTCHKIYGEATAILTGDALLTFAFETLAGYNQSISEKYILKAILLLAKAAGPLAMVGGQMMDITFEKKEVNLNDVSLMEIKKTGQMIAVSIVLGAVLSAANNKIIEQLTTLGLYAGEAFQIVDDLLDLYGEQKLIGKNIGSDIEKNKKTFLSFNNKRAAEERIETLLNKSLKILSNLNGKNDNLKNLIKLLINRKN